MALSTRGTANCQAPQPGKVQALLRPLKDNKKKTQNIDYTYENDLDVLDDSRILDACAASCSSFSCGLGHPILLSTYLNPEATETSPSLKTSGDDMAGMKE